jgi:hypothetical protein
MMKRILLFILPLSFNFCSGQVSFQKVYGQVGWDVALSIEQTLDSGYIVGGYSSDTSENYNFYLVKTNRYGDTVWTKTYGGIDNEYGCFVQHTLDDGYIVAGSTPSFGFGSMDVYLIKTDAVGNSEWVSTYGTIGIDLANSIKQTMDGGFIIVGYVEASANLKDVCLFKTDFNGSLTWSKKYGGLADDFGNVVQQTSDNGYIVIGNTKSFGGGNSDIYFLKTDSSGNLLWSKTYGGIGNEGGNSVSLTTDGGYIITGYTGSFGAGNFDAYIIRADSIGDTLWTKCIGSSYNEKGYFIEQTFDGGYIMGGSIEGSGFLLKMDINGDSLWTKIFGGFGGSNSYSGEQTNDGGYILSGASYNFTAGQTDFYLVKTDSLGNSGCYEINMPMIISNTTTIVSIPSDNVTTAFLGNMSSGTVMGSGAIVTTICSSLGIELLESNSEKNIFIYPNPVHNIFTISFNGQLKKDSGVLMIYDLTGREVFKQELHSQLSTVNCQLNSGVYFVKVQAGEKVFAEKLVVE